MDVKGYKSMCLNIIHNTQWYRPVPMSHIDYYIKQYKDILARAYHKGLIDANTLKFLDSKNPTNPTFHALPKVHKSLLHSPGRPIISTVGHLRKERVNS